MMMTMTYGSGSLQSVSSKMAFKVPSQPGDHRLMTLAIFVLFFGIGFEGYLRWSPFGRGG